MLCTDLVFGAKLSFGPFFLSLLSAPLLLAVPLWLCCARSLSVLVWESSARVTMRSRQRGEARRPGFTFGPQKHL